MPNTKRGDRAWHPRQESKRRAAPPEGVSRTEVLLKLMRSDASPAKIGIANTGNTQLKLEQTPAVYTPSKLTFSSPQKGARSSKVFTPKGTSLFPSRLLTFDNGEETALFLPANKVENKTLKIPTPTAWVAEAPVPEETLEGYVDIPLTLSEIIATEKLKNERQRRGEDPRGTSQNKLTKIPATRALRLAGFDVEDGQGQWLHHIPHSCKGDFAQCLRNLGLGTKQANAAMELVNPVLKELLRKYKENLPALYLSTQPEWVPGFKEIRLMNSLTYIIKDAPGNQATKTASIRFDTLSLDPICVSEIPVIRAALLQKFAPSPKPVVPPSPLTKRLNEAEYPSAKRARPCSP
jgi:hypothetical protein